LRLGQLLHALVSLPGRAGIYIGGGVVNAQQHLFVRVRKALERTPRGLYRGAGNLAGPRKLCRWPPSLGDLAGPLGALAIAADAGGAVAHSPKRVGQKCLTMRARPAIPA